MSSKKRSRAAKSMAIKRKKNKLINDCRINNLTENNINLCLNQDDSTANDDNNLKLTLSNRLILDECPRNNNTSLLNDLRDWVLDSNINHVQLSNLLCILKPYHPELPLSSKTLLKTNDHYKIINMISMRQTVGKFVYFGIEKCLQMLMPRICDLVNECCVELVINVDGLPIYKSNSSQFWPILISVYLSHFICSPFPIAIYCGDSKPQSVNDYLSDFVNEINILSENGFVYNNKIYFVKIKSIVCDTPARAFIKCIKGHGGYYSCERCNVKGVRKEGKIVYSEQCTEIRTHETFLHQIHKGHHLGVTPLTKIKHFNLICGFELDHMHMVYLGVMKRLLQTWIKVRGSEHSILMRNIVLMNRTMWSLSKCIPYEFQRKPRSFMELDRWKATEFRLFTLYIGPIILKNILTTKKFKHFLYLHCAIVIVSSKRFIEKYGSIAIILINKFFKKTLNIYGETMCVYNFHSIVHLVTEAVHKKQSINEISCFPFESCLGKLLKSIRSPNKPLEQVCRRLSEYTGQNFKLLKKVNTNLSFNSNEIITMNFKNMKIKPNSEKDRYVLLKSNKILQINKIVKNNDEISISGQIYQNYSEIYSTSKIKSTNLYYFVVSNLSTYEFKVKVSEIQSKCMLLHYNNFIYALPLIHCLDF